MGKKYKVETDKGTYIVETDEPEQPVSRGATGSWDDTAQSAIPFSPTEARQAVAGIPGQLGQMGIGAAQGIGNAALGAVQWAQDIPRQTRELAAQPTVIDKLKYLVGADNARGPEAQQSTVTPTPPALQPNTPGQRAGQALSNAGMLAGASAVAGPSMAGQTAIGAMGGGALGATPEQPYAASVAGGALPFGIKTGAELAGKAAQVVSPDRAIQNMSTISGKSRALLPQEQQAIQLFTRAVGPSDPQFQRDLPRALDEMKTAEATLGPQTTAEGHIKLVRQASQDLNDRFNAIVKPQEDVTFPGSGLAIARAKIAAIPDYIRIQDPAQYQKLVGQIMTENTKDLKLGDLNKLRSSGNKILNPRYGATLNAQLTKDEAVNTAMLKAQTDTARQMLYSGLDNYGRGGGQEARNIGQGIGSLLTVNDPLEKSVNTAVAQRAPMTLAQRAASAIRLARYPVGSSVTGLGRSPTIDQDLTEAMRRWSGRGPASQVTLRATAPINRQLPPPSPFNLPGQDASRITASGAPPGQMYPPTAQQQPLRGFLPAQAGGPFAVGEVPYPVQQQPVTPMYPPQRTPPRLLGPAQIQLPERMPGNEVDAVGHGLTGGRPSQNITNRMSPEERIQFVEYLKKLVGQ